MLLISASLVDLDRPSVMKGSSFTPRGLIVRTPPRDDVKDSRRCSVTALECEPDSGMQSYPVSGVWIGDIGREQSLLLS